MLFPSVGTAVDEVLDDVFFVVVDDVEVASLGNISRVRVNSYISPGFGLSAQEYVIFV